MEDIPAINRFFPCIWNFFPRRPASEPLHTRHIRIYRLAYALSACGHNTRQYLLKADEYMVEIYVRQNNVDQALRALKKKLQNEGVLREMKARRHFEKPSEKRVREKAEAVRRVRKLARKRAQLEGLLPMKKKKKRY